MKEEILEMTDIEKELKSLIKEKPDTKKTKSPKKVKYIYKITNKTFQPIQLIINENEMILLGSRKKDNIAFVKHITSQITNLEKKGMIKIRKMS